MVPKGGLEPPRVAPHAPQTCASANSATSAPAKGEYLTGRARLSIRRGRSRPVPAFPRGLCPDPRHLARVPAEVARLRSRISPEGRGGGAPPPGISRGE